MSYATFRVALFLVGVAMCSQATAEPKPQFGVTTAVLLNFPGIDPSSAATTDVINAVTELVRTNEGPLPTVYSTVTATDCPASGVPTVCFTHYFPVIITEAVAQQIVKVETVTQFVAPSAFVVTKTAILECSSTVTTTRTRTWTRTQQYSSASTTTTEWDTAQQIQT